ncbi:MAG: c-type cytochrome [Neisseria sp.]|nr:c-type cytochrome [Neisseria sp.]
MNTFRKFQRGAASFTLISGLIIAVLFIYLLYLLATSGTSLKAEDASDVSIGNRIHPVGMVKVSDGVEPGMRDGEQVFTKVCFQCHAADAIMANSPKLGNAAEWAPRIAKGFDALIQSSIDGINTMPARGGGTDLTDEELARAIAYMANQSGANFVAPPIEGEEAVPAEADTADAAASEAAQ